ncbi:MAG: T9SS type A sorting domain-containing protein [Chitinophagales bacterium]|nr:T9SS type A sorting domain-containing protein [Chitinophagales bacterium]MCZ2394820.1 T9SS type A sorting domain-containing protein [Chitinophagales bacterium]
MKKQFLLFTILLCAFILKAQVPNPDFESWANEDPTGWWSLDQLNDLGACTKSNDAHSGKYAAFLKPVAIQGSSDLVASALALSNIGRNGIAYKERPEEFSAWVKYNTEGKDVVMILATLTNANGEIIGAAGGDFEGTKDTYTQLNFPFTYSSASTPDSLQIIFFIGIPDELSASSNNSFLLVDALSFKAGNVEIPSSPSSLLAYHSGGENQYVTLEWEDNSNNESEFIIERSLGNGRGAGTYVQVGSVGPDIKSFEDITVTAGETYLYQTRAKNSAGVSNPSNAVSITVPTSTLIKEEFALNTNIYPNPAKDYLNITFPIEMNHAQLRIFNTLGAIVSNQSVNGKTAYIPFNLAPGLYILDIQSTSQPRFSKPFIVK